jgi:acyl carrier protein
MLTEDVRQFILRSFPMARKKGIEVDDLLLESGIVDSLGVLTIVDYLVEQHEVEIDEDDLMPENFATVQAIAELIERKRGP